MQLNIVSDIIEQAGSLLFIDLQCANVFSITIALVVALPRGAGWTFALIIKTFLLWFRLLWKAELEQ